LGLVSTVFKGIAFALFLLSLGYGLKYYNFSKQIEDLRAQYRKEFLDAFPAMKKQYQSPTLPFAKLQKDSLSMLGDRAKAKKRAVDEFIELNKGSGSLVALQKISEFLPKEIKVDVVEYRYTARSDGSGLVRIRVEGDSFDTLAKFRESLIKVPVLTEVVEKSSDSKPGTETKIAVIEASYMPHSSEI
jgi:hypothetical protein